MKQAIRQSLIQIYKVFMLCSFVILANVVFGWVLLLHHFSFYLAVFFFLFIPVWLIVFGVVFQPKWKWHSMLIGSFLSIFFLCMGFFVPSEDLIFRFLNALLLGGIGGMSTLWGWMIRRLVTGVRQDFAKKKRKQRRDEAPTSLNM